MAQNITTPVGRLVGGSLYDLTENKDAKGNVKIGKDGQPQKSCWFHLAIPKGTERHWTETPWGRQIWEEGHKGHPSYAPHAGFAWKIEDGDDTTPVIKRQGRKNSDNENLRGCWLVKFASSFTPKVYNKDGSQLIVEVGAVKLGYFIQVNMDVSCNTGDSPGVYLNPRLVALSAYGAEIFYGIDPSAAGFGTGPLPPGASAVPPASFTPAPPGPVTAAVPPAYTPAPPVAAAPPVYAPPAAPAVGYGTSGVAPAPSFLHPPTAGMPPVPGAVAPPAPPAPPAPQAPIMTTKANGIPYETWIAQGWDNEQLVANGYMMSNLPY